MIQVDSSDLDFLLSALQNPAPALKAIGEALVESTRARIESTKLSPENQLWAPWSLGTFLARTKKGNAGQGLLFDSGQLSQSIGYEVQDDSVTVGTTLGYASYLQEGTQTMPARPFVGISAIDDDRISEILRAHLQIR